MFTKYGEQARAVLEALLDKYADEGVAVMEDRSVRSTRFQGAPMELAKLFGGRDGYEAAVKELGAELYTVSA